MTDKQSLLLRPHPFTMDHGVVTVHAGQTIEAMLREAAGGEVRATLRVEIGGYEVPPALWARVRPKLGTAIHVTAMPAGGGGARKILRTLLLVALTVFTAGVASGAYLAGVTVLGMGGATLAAAISIVGSLVINALIPPPKPPGFGGGSMELGNWNMLTGSSNQAAPYGVIPLVIGQAKVFPPHAAMPYSETLGDTSYQRLLFDLGHGDVDVTDLKIGETPIEDFDEVEYEITKTPTLYTGDVSEVAVSAAMNDLDVVTRTTAPGIDEISLDIVFQQGLFGLDSQGKDKRVAAVLTVEYRAVGTEPWVAVPVTGLPAGTPATRTTGLTAMGAAIAAAQVGTPNKKPFAVGAAWSVPTGQYEVRVTRGETNWNGAAEGSRVGDATWTVLRSIKHGPASNTGTTKIAMRIKATEQLNGTLQTLSCVVHQRIHTYDPLTETWSPEAVASLNPAWVAWWLMTACPAFIVHAPPERMDLDSFARFAAFCEAHDFEVRGVQDTATTAKRLIDEVLACSLGSLSQRDGKYGVLFDDGNTLPTMVFTPLDSRGFAASRVFTRLPHALKVRFRNPAAYWEQDEIMVLDDGFSYRGVDARGVASADPEPTEFETLELRMSCDAHSAWRSGRFHLAQAKFRGTNYTWDTDIANLACTRGDLVHVAHDVTEWGDGWGRVVSLVAGGYGGAAATLTLDERVTTEPGESYSVRIRKADGSSVVVAAVPHSVETDTFYLASLPAGVEYGDVAVIGQTGIETAKLLITGIEPGADLSARIRAVAYDDRVAPYWADPPEVIVSEVTGTAYRDPPNAPLVTVVVTEGENQSRDDAGISTPEVHLRIEKPSRYMRVDPIYHDRLAY